ncbi:hypothetical protein TrRE_jg7167, partial [Triparma retinervis]
VFVSAVTYASLVFAFDRPRGELFVELDVDVEIKDSLIPGAGKGLFAAKPLPKNTELGLYPGVLIPTSTYRNSPKFKTAVSYAWKLSSDRGVLDPTDSLGRLPPFCPGGSSSIPLSPLLFRTLFAALSKGKPTALAMINEPPDAKDANVEVEESEREPRAKFYVKRDVEEGEELYLYYGPNYDRTGYK